MAAFLPRALVGLVAISPAASQTVNIVKKFKAAGCAAADQTSYMAFDMNTTECKFFPDWGIWYTPKCVDGRSSGEPYTDATCTTPMTTTTPLTTTTTVTTPSTCDTEEPGKLYEQKSCASSPPSDLVAVTSTTYTDEACTTKDPEKSMVMYIEDGGCIDESHEDDGTWVTMSRKITVGQTFVTEVFATRDCSGTVAFTKNEACGVCNSTEKKIVSCPGADLSSASPAGPMAALAILTASVVIRL